MARQDLPALGDRSDPSGLVNTLAPDRATGSEDFRSVKPDSDLRREAVSLAMVGQGPLDSHRTVDGCGCILERDEEAVASVVDLLPSMGGKQ